MAEPQAQPTLVATAANPLPAGGETDWLYLNKGKVWLRFAAWHAPVDEPQGTIILATGRAEFIEKYFETIEDLQARGFAVAAFDWRGQGGSSRLLRNVSKGHVASFDDYVDDLEAAVAAAALRGLPRPFYLLAHSMGGAVALLAASRLSGQIERMVLTAPLIELADKRASSRWAKTAASVAAGIGLARSSVRPRRAPAPQDAPFDTNVVTSDRKRFARTQEVLKAEPRLGLGAPTVRWYAAANRAIKTLNAPGFGDEMSIPALVVACGMDAVVSVRAIERFAKTLRGGGRVMVPGARHEILMERTGFRTLFWAAFDAFVPGTGLRLPTDIAPPRIKIAPPKSKAAATATATAAGAGEAAEAAGAGDVAPAAGDDAATGATSTPAAETLTSAETRPAEEPTTVVPAEATETTETNAEAETAAETPAETQPDEALAPAAPEAAEVEKRSRFGFFRRRKPAAAEPAPEEATAPETGTDGSTVDAASEPQETDQPNTAEAAFAAAADLVAQATRSETPTWQQPSENAADATGPNAPAGTTETAEETGDAGAPASAETAKTSASESPSRVSRLFRRRDPGAVSEDPAETGSSGEVSEAAPAADAATAPTDPSPMETPNAPEPKKADETAEASTSLEEIKAADPVETPPASAATTQDDDAPDAEAASTITLKTATPAADPASETVVSVVNPASEALEIPADKPKADREPAPEASGITAAEVTEAAPAGKVAGDPDTGTVDAAAAESDDSASEAVTTDPSPSATKPRRKIGGGARPTPRPVKRSRKR